MFTCFNYRSWWNPSSSY